MSIRVLVNDVWRDSAEVRVTDTSNTETDEDGKNNIVGGARHLKHTQTGTGNRRYVYVAKDNSLGCDTCVVTRADRYNSQTVKIIHFATYTGAATEEFSDASFSETLVGLNSDDWVYDFSSAISSKDAIGLQLDDAYTKEVSSVYFCTRFALSDVGDDVYLFREPWDERTRVKCGGVWYLVHERITLVMTALSDSEVESFENLYKIHEWPFFLHSPVGEDTLPDNLIHCIMPENPIRKTFEDRSTVQFNVFRLKEYPDFD